MKHDWNTNFFVDFQKTDELRCSEDKKLKSNYESIMRKSEWQGTKKGCYVGPELTTKSNNSKNRGGKNG